MYMVADRLQNHIPKGIWDSTEGDDVAFVSQFVARDNGSVKVYRYKCCIGKFSPVATILPDFVLHDCHTIIALLYSTL